MNRYLYRAISEEDNRLTLRADDASATATITTIDYDGAASIVLTRRQVKRLHASLTWWLNKTAPQEAARPNLEP